MATSPPFDNHKSFTPPTPAWLQGWKYGGFASKDLWKVSLPVRITAAKNFISSRLHLRCDMERFSGLIESTKKEAIIDEERRVSPQVTSVRIGALREQRSMLTIRDRDQTLLGLYLHQSFMNDESPEALASVDFYVYNPIDLVVVCNNLFFRITNSLKCSDLDLGRWRLTLHNLLWNEKTIAQLNTHLRKDVSRAENVFSEILSRSRIKTSSLPPSVQAWINPNRRSASQPAVATYVGPQGAVHYMHMVQQPTQANAFRPVGNIGGPNLQSWHHGDLNRQGWKDGNLNHQGWDAPNYPEWEDSSANRDLWKKPNPNSHGKGNVNAKRLDKQKTDANLDRLKIDANHGWQKTDANHDGQKIDVNHGRQQIDANHGEQQIDANNRGKRPRLSQAAREKLQRCIRVVSAQSGEACAEADDKCEGEDSKQDNVPDGDKQKFKMEAASETPPRLSGTEQAPTEEDRFQAVYESERRDSKQDTQGAIEAHVANFTKTVQECQPSDPPENED